MLLTRTASVLLAVVAAALLGCTAKQTDPELESALLGMWEDASRPQEGYESHDFRPDHTESMTLRFLSDGKMVDARTKGTWRVQDGMLYEKITSWNLTGDTSGLDFTNEVVSASRDVIQLRDPKTNEKSALTRMTVARAAQAATQQTAPPASAAPVPAPAPAPPVAAAPPPKPVAPPVPEESQFLDETYFVATKDEQRIGFTLKRDARLRIVVDIDQGVPVDVLLFPTVLSSQEYTNVKMAVGIGQANEFLTALGMSERSTDTITETAVFRYGMGLSKKSAYGHYEKAADLPAGKYTLFLDNSGDFGPTRGDAPVRLQLFTK